MAVFLDIKTLEREALEQRLPRQAVD